MPPRKRPAAGAARRGGSPKAGQPNSHTGHRCARPTPPGRKRHALRRLGRAQQWPEWLLGCPAFGLPTPFWLRLRRGVWGVRRITHFAAAQLRSDKRGESDHEACARRRPCHPANAPPQAQPEGGGQPSSPTAKQPHGPLLRSAQSAHRAGLAPGRCGPSEATARMDVRLRVPFRMRRGAQVLADQGSRLFE